MNIVDSKARDTKQNYIFFRKKILEELFSMLV